MHERVHVRTGVVAAAGLAAALALTGCGSGSGDDTADQGKGQSQGQGQEQGGATATPSGADGVNGGGSDPGPGSGSASASASASGEPSGGGLEGTWAGLSDSKVIALSVKDGQATLVAGQHVCNGTVERAGATLALKCADGDTERTSGTVGSNDGTTVVVSWSTGAKDTLTKTEPGGFSLDVPTQVPTTGPTSS
ncbi:hypothetical protein [Streptomyces formicae]|uniref:Lipoprotein n=1 Tax=Streptomyces formicae TaxID=1616117 RepID=A0ABY3WD92_9ACTN|nr:hypothetical protein [Streptomyces formicae]UNM10517.1 hypothetical protein J4032_02445 [Streptomyces formicae]